MNGKKRYRQMSYSALVICGLIIVLNVYQTIKSRGEQSQKPSAQPIEVQAQPTSVPPTSSTTQKATDKTVDENAVIHQAYLQQHSNVQVHGIGVIKAVLPDDRKGLPHQRFILDIGQGQTVLVAHNMDFSSIPNLQKGETVEFYGEYEYNPQGGVIHWTHHDPDGRHENGWLKYQGRMYQ